MEHRLVSHMHQQSPTTCEVCDRAAAGRFAYRTLNATYRREEPLCEWCATMLVDIPSVAEVALSQPAGSPAERSVESD